MIDRIIAEYVRNNKRLVVPGFGTFIRKDDGQVVFVEFLKKDDGILSAIVAGIQGTDTQTAIGSIEQYVATLKRTIGEDGGYNIEKLGRMYVTPSGLYELDTNPSAGTGSGSGTSKTTAIKAASSVSTDKVEDASDSRKETTAKIEGDRAEHGTSARASQNASIQNTMQPKRVSAGSESRTGVSARQPLADKVEPGNAMHAAARIKEEDTAAYRQSERHTYASGGAERTKQPSANTAKPLPYRAWDEQDDPKRRRPATMPTNKPAAKKKTDVVMVVAIIAASLALLAMLFALWVDKTPSKSMQPVNPETEQVVNSEETGETN